MRTVLTARWLGLFVAALALAAIMVFLGRWQLDRYELRTTMNDRIAAGESGEAVPVASVLPRPEGGAGTVGARTPDDAAWQRVSVTGVYDSTRELLVRNRTGQGQAGFEVITPLVQADGTAVLIDRGWIPASPKGPTVAPAVPAAPTGTVTVIGRVHPSESGGTDTLTVDGRTEIRRIVTGPIARYLNQYAVYDAYLLAVDGTPGVTAAPVAVPTQNAWQNAAYVVQWWLFAGLTLVGFVYLLRKEIKQPSSAQPDRVEGSQEAAPVP
ncbi:MAG: SURF1 family protein [Hamadaea sp.]|uniref:SURF1 family cytochrome oxidase biogenesis protein n=1 Tax=Hamadaea sp. TaxID=2024425 RepID=UPI00184191DB|nr:SURF1 family protein [Hamadaea sp.]NUR73952.1 SURF1 family protein [Hamadaea sp.]NUT21898.1 SURF1 family protein [Hamadaea sp.]